MIKLLLIPIPHTQKVKKTPENSCVIDCVPSFGTPEIAIALGRKWITKICAHLHYLEIAARDSQDLEVLNVGLGDIALNISAGTAVGQADRLS